MYRSNLGIFSCTALFLTLLTLIAGVPYTASAATMQANRPWAALSGLVGYWSFNGPDVTDKVYDRSGQGNDVYFEGGATSSAKVAGKLGQAMKFDGVDDVIYADIPSLDGATDVPFAWSWWTKSTGESNEEMGWGPYRSCKSRGWAGGTMGCVVDGGGSPLLSSTGVEDGVWHHIVLTHTPGAQSIFVDGVLEGTSSQAFTTGAYYYTFGTRPFSGYFNGSLDEVRIYNRAITPAEVKALYRAGSASVARTHSTGVKTGLVGWWTFDGKDVQGTAPASADTGIVGPTTGSTLAGGTLSWANTGNILTDNNTRASVTLSGTAQSDYLRASNFGFAIPADATIVGIQADIQRRRSGGTAGNARDYSVRLVDDTGTLVGSDKAWTATNWPTAEDLACNGPGCYGTGSTDLWGTTLTPAQVNDPDFGFAIQVSGALAGADRVAEVDLMYMYVYYITPGGALDKSGSGNHGTLTNGVKAAAGRIGQAMQFDGVDDYIDAGSPAVLDDMTQKTICHWIYPVTIPVTFALTVSKESSGTGWDLEMNSNDGNNRFEYFQNFSGTNGSWKSPTDSVPFNKWSHVCVSYDNSSLTNDPVIYINGQSVTVTELVTPTGTIDVDSLSPLRIGAWNGAGELFDGKIDDVRIYNRLLTATEIKKIYQEGAGTVIGKSQPNLVPSGLVGYWSFNGLDFTDKVYDRSGQDNYGYVINAATTSVKTAGKVGQALKLDGVDDYVANYLPSSLDNISLISACAWIKPNSLAGRIIAKGYIFVNWSLFLDTDGTLNFNRNRNTSWGYWSSPASSISAGKWQHVCVVTNDRLSTANDPVFYINGLLTTTIENNPPIGSVTSDIATALSIGNLDGGSDYFNGSIDEVRIYNRILTATEVKKLYQSGR